MAMIQHIATAADWAEARRSGTYTTSTRGRTLEEEGFVHASRPDQVKAVWEALYRDLDEPLVLLTIDPARLDAEVREEPVGEDTYPHVYGPIPTSAVVRVAPLDRRGGTPSFTQVFFTEVMVRAGLLLGAMLLSVAGHSLAGTAGALVGLAVGLLLVAVVLRKRG